MTEQVFEAKTYTGDCLEVMRQITPGSVDLAYLDPPFFSQKPHRSATRDGATSFSFEDVWKDCDTYGQFLFDRLAVVRDLLRDSGSVFVHCDRSASHLVRLLLDRVLGASCFQSEIIWSFRRWSNARKGLLSAHHTIFFYSKTADFKFHTVYGAYSPATNVEQILQKRTRDSRNKAVYARDANGRVLHGSTKQGVPLSDVWDIPFLNPKARERVGYPTQKPILLLGRILELATDEGDLVLDPFCGSGTTLLAATLLKRNSIGIDQSEEAIRLTRRRLQNPEASGSRLLTRGRESYRNHSKEAEGHLFGVRYTPFQRNGGLDGLLKEDGNAQPVFVRVQRSGESLAEAAASLKKAAQEKGACRLVLVATHADLLGESAFAGVDVVPSTSLAMATTLRGR